MKPLLEIFCTFFKIGLFTFGGGYAMIPLLQKEVVEKRRWLPDGEFVETFAVSQAIPGAAAVNSAVLIGFRLAGYGGALTALLGVVLPSFAIR